MAFALSVLFWIGVVPLVAAAALMFAGHRCGVRPSAAWAVSVGGAFVVGQLVLDIRNLGLAALAATLRPHEASDWLSWLVLIAVGIAVLAAYAPRAWQRWILSLACVFAISIPVRLLAGSAYATLRWSLGVKLAAIFTWAVVILLLWTLLAWGRTHARPHLRALLLAIVALGMAATMTLSGSFTYGALCGVAAAAIVGSTLGEACFSPPGNRRSVSSPHGLSGAAGPLAVLLGGLILLGYFFAALSSTAAVLLACAIPAAAGRLPLRPGQGWGETALRVVLVLVCLTMALVLAYTQVASNPYR